MSQQIKPGDKVRVWWETGERNAAGGPIARVLDVWPYVGPHTDFVDTILRLTASNTLGGDISMSWDTRTAVPPNEEHPYWRGYA